MTCFTTNNELGGSQQNASSTYITLVDIAATTGALRRVYVYGVAVGVNGTLAGTNCQIVFDVPRMTAEGTATTLTPTIKTQLETGTQSPALSTSKGNHTAEPTYTANSSLLYRSFNQQGAYQWVAYKDDDRLQAPAVAANGFGVRVKSTNYVSTANAELDFEE